MTPLADAIARHPFTGGLNPRYLHLLSEGATTESFRAGQTICRENGEADCLYLLLSGEAALQNFIPGESTTTVQTIGAGETLGWAWLYPPYRWHLSAVSIEPIEAVRLDACKLREAIEENHDFGYEIASRVGRILSDRLRAAHVRLAELYHVPS